MIVYIIKSSICLALLLLIYHLVLEQEKMHKFNRFFLLVAILFSITIPELELNLGKSFVSNTTNTIPFFITESNSVSSQTEHNLSIAFLLKSIYVIGVLIMLIRFSKNLFSIYTLKKTQKLIKKENYNLVLIKAKLPVHSFFNNIYVNQLSYENGELNKYVIKHELNHIKQKHSLDILFVEIVQLFFWFNPLIYFYKKAIKMNHEFLADTAVIESLQDSSMYTKTLLKNIFRNNPNYLASSLNYSLTKKRFIMMTKKQSKRNILIKKMLAIPLFVCFTLVFSTKTAAQSNGVSNALMKEYKSKTVDGKIKMKDYDRLIEIYDAMSESQKESVTKVPPPPPKPGIAPPPYKDADFYINGKKVNYSEVEKLKPEDIKSVDVKKQEGKKGAVYITLK